MVDDAGLLLPLHSAAGGWYDGVNTAECSPPTGDGRRGQHAVPSVDCECGFYAYGTVAAAAHNRQLRYVQAVVSCWGRGGPSRPDSSSARTEWATSPPRC